MYQSDGEWLEDDKVGEGIVKWIDAENVIYEREWWKVLRVSPQSGRISIGRWWWDGENPRMTKAWLSPSQSKLDRRPDNNPP